MVSKNITEPLGLLFAFVALGYTLDTLHWLYQWAFGSWGYLGLKEAMLSMILVAIFAYLAKYTYPSTPEEA